MLYFVAGIGGFIIGVIVGLILIRIKTSTGALLIDHSNPEKDIYQINIDKFDDLDKKSRIWLRVNHNANLKSFSQE